MNKHVGSSIDDFLEEEGIRQEAAEIAAKRVLAWKLEQARKRCKLSKKKLAQRMNVSDTQLLRLFDPENTGVTLHTMTKAATALGLRVEIDLVEDNTPAASGGPPAKVLLDSNHKKAATRRHHG